MKLLLMIIFITWNPVPDVKGYKVYYGSKSKKYTSVKDVGNITKQGFAITKTTYFAVTAYNEKLESLKSSELIICDIKNSSFKQCEVKGK